MDLPGANDGRRLAPEKWGDSLIAEYAAVVAASEASRQAALTRLVLFSGLMSGVFAVALDVRGERERILLSVLGLLSSMYWFVALYRDHLVTEERFTHGNRIERRLAEALGLHQPAQPDNDAPPEFFTYCNTGIGVGSIATAQGRVAKWIALVGIPQSHFILPSCSVCVWFIVLVLNIYGWTDTANMHEVVEVLKKVHFALRAQHQLDGAGDDSSAMMEGGHTAQYYNNYCTHRLE